MNQPEFESFPAEVALRLKTYVYRLIDPRNGEPFYVGKGQGNRVFAHIRLEQQLEGQPRGPWGRLTKQMSERDRPINTCGFGRVGQRLPHSLCCI